MIRFVLDGSSVGLTFSDVEDNQFFVDRNGYFCQKTYSDSYVMIADHDGNPYSYFFDDVLEDSPINKVLPRVTKIKFG